MEVVILVLGLVVVGLVGVTSYLLHKLRASNMDKLVLELAFIGSENRVSELEEGVRAHRDQKGDDRCWMDDETLYRLLPEGYDPPARDSRVELAMCEKFIACRHNPGTEYVSPQRRIEELEAEVRRLESILGDDR